MVGAEYVGERVLETGAAVAGVLLSRVHEPQSGEMSYDVLYPPPNVMRTFITADWSEQCCANCPEHLIWWHFTTCCVAVAHDAPTIATQLLRLIEHDDEDGGGATGVAVGGRVVMVVGECVVTGSATGADVVGVGPEPQLPQSVQSVPTLQYLGSSHMLSLAYLHVSVLPPADDGTGALVEGATGVRVGAVDGVTAVVGTIVVGELIGTPVRGEEVRGDEAGYAPAQMGWELRNDESGL